MTVLVFANKDMLITEFYPLPGLEDLGWDHLNILVIELAIFRLGNLLL
jgi:hypothetical protein